MNVKLDLTNYKLLKKLNLDLQGSNVYLITGENEQGKSSLLEAFISLLTAKNDVPVPVTFGEKEALVIGIIENADGDVYSVTMEAKEEGKAKFTMVNPNGLKTSSVTSIRDVLGYQNFTAEEFVSWGNNAEGRKKQSDILLKCMDSASVALYNKMVEEETILFDQRTPLISDEKHYKKAVSDINLSDMQLDLMKESKEEVFKQIEQSKTEYNNVLLNNVRIQNLQKEITDTNITYKQITTQIEIDITDIDAQIEELKQRKTNKLNELDALELRYATKVDALQCDLDLLEVLNIDELQVNYDMALSMEKLWNDTEYVYQDFLRKKTKYEETVIKRKDYDEKIEIIRNKRKSFIKENSIFDDIVIENDGIYVIIGDEQIPFNDKQISTSRQMLIAIKILLKLNSKLPMIMVGRGESFDDNKLKQLQEIAEDNNAIILLEKVIPNGPLAVECLVNG